MFLPKLDYLRYQTRFAVHIAARDLGKRLSTAALIVGLVFWVKGAEHAAGIGLVLAAYEIAGIWLYRRIADLDEDISLRYILAVWAVNWSSVIAYAWPAFVLSQEPSAALLLGGVPLAVWRVRAYLEQLRIPSVLQLEPDGSVLCLCLRGILPRRAQ